MKDRRRLKTLRRKFGKNGNYYILLLHIKAALKEKKSVTPRLYAAAAEKLKSASLRVSAEEYTDYLVYKNRIFGFTEREICAVDHAAALVILRVLASLKEDDAEALDRLSENAAYTLRSLQTTDFEERYLSLSALDAYLRENDPVYPLSDRATQNDQKSRIEAYAKKHRIDEIAAARILAEQKPFPGRRARGKGAAYFSFLAAGTLLFTLAAFFLGVPLLLLPLLLFPLSELAKGIVEECFRRFTPTRPIPKLDLDEIPEGAETLVVITTLLTSTSEEPFERIERFFLSNREKRARFGLLLDFADADERSVEKDDELAAFAESKIRALNEKYGNYFFVALRERSYSESERRYIGEERKRGAIIDLVRYVKDEGDAFRLFLGDRDFIRKAKYLVTLDADTNLFIGAVRIMVGAMLHPDNRPVIENGAVREGYAILQPRMAVTVRSATRSRFSLLLCGSGGIDVYASAAFDVYQNLFGEGIFCGKGILDIDVFAQLIPNAFKKEAILSHDLIEGNLLRAGFLSDVVLTDSFPASPLSFFTRMHRWYRGDVQALPYAGRAVRNADGKRRKNPADSLSRYKLLDNLRRLLIAPSVFLALILSLFFGKRAELAVAAAFLAYLLLPLFLTLTTRRHGIFRRYFSQILHSFGYAFANLLFQISALAHQGYLALNALFSSLFRMFVSHRHLLAWTTADRAEKKKNTAFAYLRSSWFSMTAGFLTLTFAQSPPLRLFGMLWLAFPLILVLLAHEYPARPKPLSEHAKASLSRYVFDMWGYFDKFVTAEDNYLPPDNYQQLPVRALAHRTSPTNIGMYLLSCLAARDFGFIDSKELLCRTSSTLETLEKLPKKYGHLYNWYDTKTLALLGVPYISTVDSGNFVVSLLTLVGGLEEYAAEEPALRRVIYRFEKLIEAADFSALYCKKRELFYIARDGEEPSPLSCYDLYMSEARTTSYYAVACGIVPKKHWECLSRIVVGKGRYTGLASWSGTAFEYFMPHLFLPIPRNSLAYEALSFCVDRQEHEKIEGLFGISESAYYAFDADMNYQYRAHGLDTLSLDVTEGRNRVLSPYSSFLMLASAPHAALANLAALRDFGAYGEFGFYEAIDFTPASVGKGSAIVRSFMSHHLGMSIVAAANACFDNLFVRRFMRDRRMAAAAELLEERIPTGAPLFRGKLSPTPGAKSARVSPSSDEKKLRTEKKNDRLPKIALLSNGILSLRAASSGEVELFCREIALTRPALSLHDTEGPLSSLRLCYAEKERCFTVLPDLFSYSGTKAVFTTLHDKLTIKITLTLHGEKNLFGISFSASGAEGILSVALVLEPILSTVADFSSHPFYRALSIEAFLSEENGILFFRCRAREEEGEKWLALSAEGEGEFAFDTRKDILPFGYTEKDVEALAVKPLPGRLGACISPLAVLQKKLPVKAGRAYCEFLISYGSTKNEAADAILSVRSVKGRSAVELLSESERPVVRRMLRSLGDDRPDGKYAELYLSALFFPEKSALSLKGPTPPSALYAASLSGDYPIIAIAPCEEQTESGRRIVSIFLKLHRLMRDKGVRSDLVFLCREKDGYNKPISKRIGKQIAEEAGNGYVGKRGGLFVVDDPNLFDAIAALSCLYIPIDHDSSPEELYYRVTGRRREEAREILTQNTETADVPVPSGALRVEGGYFYKNSFTVIKSECDTVRSYVYASPRFGTLVSASSPGFTWLSNAKECRLTSPSSDLLRDITGERILAEKEGILYDLCALADRVEFGEGEATYTARIGGAVFTVRIGVDRLLPVKLVLVDGPEDYRIRYEVAPTFGVSERYRHLTESRREGKVLFFRNFFSPHLSDQTLFLAPTDPEEGRRGFLLGVYSDRSERLYRLIRSKYRDAAAIEAGFLEYASHYRNLFAPLRFRLPRPELEVMLNHFVPYQAYVIRMLARTGYHQSSGAYGFRDQLQDSLAMLPYDEKITLRQIYRAAAHQYAEGDVQHWWHPFPTPDGTNAGIRTRISDDMLWLPYAVSEYLRVTGDKSVLTARIAYLESPPLAVGEIDRYEIPKKSAHRESVYQHCMRAIEASLNFTPDGLPLIGGGDWNDAFNRVGINGKGTSVFLARFMQIVFTSFSRVAKTMKDDASAEFLLQKAKSLSEAVERHAWEKDRYLRGRYDSGAPLGSASSQECRIDILAQSFSALAEGANDRTTEAMRTAYALLYDKEAKLLRLFDPPFGERKKDAGYISSYCEGFRENGGQYNHGALFGARGFFAVGENRRGFEILEAVNPAARSMHHATAAAYRSEPYAFCGDIYTNPSHMGRGGWSLYTGAAGWFLTTVLEVLLGYRESADYFTLTPALSEKLPSFSLKISRKNTVYHISVALGEKARLSLDGQKSENRFFFDGKSHILEMDIEKSGIL